jgi:hypothetical protein
MSSPSRLTAVAATLAAVILVPTASAAPHKGHQHARPHAHARLHASSQTSTQQPATATEVQAEGTITAVSSTSLTIQLHESSSSMTFVVPAGFDLGGAQVGDLADAKGTQAADGTITLTELEVQAAETSPPAQGTEVEAEGSITALSSTSVTIQQQEGGASVTFAVPPGFDLGGAQVGDSADAKGLQAADGTITLTELEVQGGGSGDQQGGQGDQGGQQQQRQSSGDQGSGSGEDGSGD